jgi:hypothetical protein
MCFLAEHRGLGLASRVLLLLSLSAGAAGQGANQPGTVETFTVRRPRTSTERRTARAERSLDRPTYEPLKFRKVELPPPDPEFIRSAQEDTARNQFRRVNVGIHRAVSWSMEDAQWEQSGAEWRARLAVRSETALGIRLHLANMSLPEGSRLYIYSPDEKQPAESFTQADAIENSLWSQILDGDTALLELVVPSTNPVKPAVAVQVSEVSHLYTRLGGFGTPSSCEKDASCYPAWAGVGDAVALIYGSWQTTFVCSGVLLNNRALDYSPMFLTAKHCFSDSTTAQSAVVYWKYKSSSCNGSVPDTATVPQTRGAELLSMSTDADATLLLLTGSVPDDIPFAGWTTDMPPLSTPITVLHHPHASYLRYAQGQRSADLFNYPNYLSVYWGTGIIEPGSSGSPGFNSAQQIVGHLAMGSSQCGTFSGPDLIAKFSVAYPDLNLTGNGDILVNGLADDKYAPNFTQATAAPLPIPFPKTNLVMKHTGSNSGPDWFVVSLPPYTKVAVTTESTGTTGGVSASGYMNGNPFGNSSTLSYRSGSAPETWYFSINSGSIYAPYNLAVDSPPATVPTIQSPSLINVYANAATILTTVTTGGLPTTYAVEYSADANFGTYSTTPTSSINPGTGFNASDGGIWGSLFILGLQPQTTYYARVMATNDMGTVRVPIPSFTTPEAHPALHFDVANMNFGDVLLGKSRTQSSVLFWVGNTLVTSFDSVTVEPPFFIQSANCPIYTNCSIVVGFQPTVVGTFSGTVRAAFQGTVATLPVYGAGIDAARLSVGTVSAPAWYMLIGSTLTISAPISNTGTSPMVIRGLSSSPASVSSTTDCPASIAPGGACMLSIKLSPTTTGYLNGAVILTTNSTIPQYTVFFYVNVIDLALRLARPARSARSAASSVSAMSADTEPPARFPVPTLLRPLFSVPELEDEPCANAGDVNSAASKAEIEGQDDFRARRLRRCNDREQPALQPVD